MCRPQHKRYQNNFCCRKLDTYVIYDLVDGSGIYGTLMQEVGVHVKHYLTDRTL